MYTQHYATKRLWNESYILRVAGMWISERKLGNRWQGLRWMSGFTGSLILAYLICAFVFVGKQSMKSGFRQKRISTTKEWKKTIRLNTDETVYVALLKKETFRFSPFAIGQLYTVQFRSVLLRHIRMFDISSSPNVVFSGTVLIQLITHHGQSLSYITASPIRKWRVLLCTATDCAEHCVIFLWGNDTKMQRPNSWS